MSLPTVISFSVKLSPAELDIAQSLIGGFLDNEHDKGADEGHGSEVGEMLLQSLEEAVPDEAGSVTVMLHPYEFGLLAEWVSNTVESPDFLETDEEIATLKGMHERFSPIIPRIIEI